jgi:hypothetical protein
MISKLSVMTVTMYHHQNPKFQLCLWPCTIVRVQHFNCDCDHVRVQHFSCDCDHVRVQHFSCNCDCIIVSTHIFSWECDHVSSSESKISVMAVIIYHHSPKFQAWLWSCVIIRVERFGCEHDHVRVQNFSCNCDCVSSSESKISVGTVTMYHHQSPKFQLWLWPFILTVQNFSHDCDRVWSESKTSVMTVPVSWSESF